MAKRSMNNRCRSEDVMAPVRDGSYDLDLLNRDESLLWNGKICIFAEGVEV